MAAKTAKTIKVVRTTKTARVVKTAGARSTVKVTPSFPQRRTTQSPSTNSKQPVDPWRTPIARDFTPAPTKPRQPAVSGPALQITRGGGTKTKVTGVAARRADRVEKKKGKVAVAKPPKKVAKTVSVVARERRPKVEFSDDENAMVVNKKNLKALAKLVKMQLEGKPLVKRKQYPARNSTIVRVPNAILGLVRQQIEAYRSRQKKSE